MKRLLFFVMITLVTVGATAQPKARRQQQKQQQQAQQQKGTQTQNQGMTMRARLMFPTAIDMPEDVVWRRDIYREIDLNKDANAGLYYPVEPMEKQLNLFTYIFKLALNNYIPVYEYRLDGNESFTDSARVQMKTVLDNYHIFYEEKDGKLRVDNSDVPSAEVKLYYLKESAYYDQANATFHRKVLAVCPVMMREDDFGGEASKYPLFWVKYSDLEPFLDRHTLMTSNLNNAATISTADYFTMNRYEGKIYKTNNMLGRTLAQYCPNDSALAKEQLRIEEELRTFERNIFGKQHRDSVDSIAGGPADKKANKKAGKKDKADSKKDAADNTDEKADKPASKKRNNNRRSAATEDKKSKASKSGSKSSGSSSGSPRVTVRRQRH
ncbi:MAG: gliding motility protein GldN [Prevotella sp.]|nr:gliding motility protein GldN [Prevotella sp.]